MFDLTGRRKAALAATLSVLCLGLSACGGDDEASSDASKTEPAATGTPGEKPEEVAKLRVGIVPSSTFLPAMVAKEEGIFEKHNLDVELTIVQNLATLPGAMGRQFDLGAITAPDIIKANSQNVDVVLVSGSADDSPDSAVSEIMLPPGSPIKTAKDLEGKTVGAASLGGNIHPSVLYYLQENGVDAKKVKFVEVPHPNHFDQLKSKRVDATESLEPFKTRMKGELKATALVDPMDPIMEKAGLDSISFVDFMAARGWAEDNQDVLQRWIDALQEAIDFIETDEATARKHFGAVTKLPPEVVAIVPIVPYDVTVSTGELAAWGNVLKSIGQVPGFDEAKVDELIVTPEGNKTE
jgi:ABC-type nitrate/sulfonate/bicarbonate transport system substrate-binding protein